MNRYTREIMAVLKLDAATALLVQIQMERDGIDYSECTAQQFRDAARAAWNVVER